MLVHVVSVQMEMAAFPQVVLVASVSGPLTVVLVPGVLQAVEVPFSSSEVVLAPVALAVGVVPWCPEVVVLLLSFSVVESGVFLSLVVSVHFAVGWELASVPSASLVALVVVWS